MQRRILRPALALGLIAVAAGLLAVFAGVSSGPQVAAKSTKLSGDPDRSRAVPGASHEGDIARATELTLEQLNNKTYPATVLPFSWQKGAADAFSQVRARGNDSLSTWQLAGPSIATYPAILNRTNADYVTSGRISALAIDPACVSGNCRVWLGAAGGGVWRTNDALASSPSWTNVSGSFGTSAIGTLTYDAASHTLYAGTGEQNESADSDAGVGIYKSTDGGDTWTLLPGSPEMSAGNSISSIVVSGGSLFVGTTYGVAGMSGVGGSAQPSYLATGTPKPGLWKSADGGGSFSLLYDDSAGAWGVNDVELDSHGVIYIASVGKGIFRSADGASWEQIFATQLPNGGRTEFALNTVDPGGHTRIYVGDGGSGGTNTGVYRADNIDTATAASLTSGGANPGYTSLTSSDRTNPGYATYNYCTGQCWYDNFVVSPAGYPDVVYVGGSYDYSFAGARDNGKAVLLSQDAGAHFKDQTWDATSGPNGIHPDQHALVVSPANPLQFFEGSDGGLMRSSGQFHDSSSDCDSRPLSAPSLVACHQMLSAIPTQLTSLNAGLSTLQFQNVVVSPADAKDIMGGTQDNGTWEGTAGNPAWPQTMYGDGGVAAFDVSNAAFRMNEFYDKYTDVNFQNGAPDKWVVVSGPFFASGEASAFYKPQINDPTTSGTLFVGVGHVWRTQDFGGNQAYLEANCPEFTTDGANPACGDFVPLGDPSGHGGLTAAGNLTASGAYGTDKSGGYVVAIARASSDNSTLWAATRRGRVFISKNANGPAGAVTFSRIDAGANLSATSLPTPRRFVSGIQIDPANPNHAYVSFGGYNRATDGVTPAVPGHVFDVLYDPLTGQATWTSLDRGNGPLGDLPVNTLALDQMTGRLYAGTDFGVVSSIGTSGKWQNAAGGMPTVAISGITIDSKRRVLYAATHGRAIWSLQLSGGGRK
jgi:hypothetical protein